ncbi:ABC transporter permease [Streptomyces thermocarboxydus]
MWFLQDNLERQTVVQSREGVLAQYALTSGAGLPASAAAEARRVPGVVAATGVRRTSVVVFDRLEPQTVPAQGIDPWARIAPWTCGSARAVSTPSAKAPSPSPRPARTRHWRLGDKARLWLGDGTPVTLRVVALYERGWGFGDITLHRRTLDGHTVTGLDDRVLIRTAPHAGAEGALAELACRYPGGQVVDTARLTGELAEDVAVSGWLNKMLVTVLVGYAVLAAANTLVMAALARTRELSLLRLVGVTRVQVKRMIHAEQAGLLGVALLIGAAIAAVTLTTIVRAVTGAAVPHVPAVGWATLLGGTAALALLATVVPVSRVLRTAPVEGMGVRE